MQEIAFQRLNISKFFRGSMPLDPPRCSRAFGARLSTLLFSPWRRHCQGWVGSGLELVLVLWLGLGLVLLLLFGLGLVLLLGIRISQWTKGQ